MNSLEIYFSKSTSKRYKEALAIAKRLKGFEPGDPNMIRFENMENIFVQWDDFTFLYNRIYKWSGTSFIYNNVPLTPFRKLSEWFYSTQDTYNCFRFHQSAYDKTGFCLDGGEWSCKRVNSVAKYLNNHFCSFWYKYGRFTGKKVWSIDKELIKSVLIEEAKQKGVIGCPAFNKNKLIQEVDKLPDQLFIDDIFWKCQYKQEWRNDGPVNVPFSIEHIYQEQFPVTEEMDSFFECEPPQKTLSEDEWANDAIERYLKDKHARF